MAKVKRALTKKCMKTNSKKHNKKLNDSEVLEYKYVPKTRKQIVEANYVSTYNLPHSPNAFPKSNVRLLFHLLYVIFLTFMLLCFSKRERIEFG